MEEYKLWYLHELLKRKNELSVDVYVIAMQQFEREARKCYVESIKLNEDEFVEMMTTKRLTTAPRGSSPATTPATEQLQEAPLQPPDSGLRPPHRRLKAIQSQNQK
ncbi:unnamed protein product [Ilex paraguariensis]|uniref:Uncharacterized protein n=1 Tax=Ilex paraguariensis TaxID=185542 RepID=A0ABC8T5T7_9AQUA